jgi:hypothetical protein
MKYMKDFSRTADARLATIATTGNTIAWPAMRDYLQQRIGGKKPMRPLSRKSARYAE